MPGHCIVECLTELFVDKLNISTRKSVHILVQLVETVQEGLAFISYAVAAQGHACFCPSLQSQ